MTLPNSSQTNLKQTGGSACISIIKNNDGIQRVITPGS